MILLNDITQQEDRIREAFPRVVINPPLLEKMLHALHLAELLQQRGLDFILKGGTSLILLLDFPERFSIDIDLITLTSKEEIEEILRVICEKETAFYRFEEHERKEVGIPKAHYKLYFRAKNNPAGASYVLLDLLFEQPACPELVTIPVSRPWLSSTSPEIKINLPSINAITGDKLTAFAPKTIGIPDSKPVEVLKQLFDLGTLIPKISDMRHVISSYQRIAKQEIAYRKLNITPNEALQDTLETCLRIVKDDYPELSGHVRSFKGWTLKRFTDDELLETTGKVAYLAAKILKGDNEIPLVFESGKMKNQDFLIENTTYNFLNKKLKKRRSGALFYWYHAIQSL